MKVGDYYMWYHSEPRRWDLVKITHIREEDGFTQIRLVSGPSAYGSFPNRQVNKHMDAERLRPATEEEIFMEFI
jgi:hypothetical protein